MKTPSIDSAQLLSGFQQKPVMTLKELKRTLHTPCRMTVLRALARRGYISSYSHRGKYYSLASIARYNGYGIWRYQGVCFSRQGTLKNTLTHLIDHSSQGYTAAELTRIVTVKVEDAVLALVRERRISRKKLLGRYVYYARGPNLRTKQDLTRRDAIQYAGTEALCDLQNAELKAALILFVSTLNEKQRRLYAGYESLKIGHGGDIRIAKLLDINPKTVAKGRRELFNDTVNLDTVREPGGGRHAIKKNSPGH